MTRRRYLMLTLALAIVAVVLYRILSGPASDLPGAESGMESEVFNTPRANSSAVTPAIGGETLANRLPVTTNLAVTSASLPPQRVIGQSDPVEEAPSTDTNTPGAMRARYLYIAPKPAAVANPPVELLRTNPVAPESVPAENRPYIGP